jgi:two-component system sensor kinase FixL
MSDRDDESRRIAVLDKAVENTNEAFVTIDSRHQVVFFNKAAERIFGFDREEVIGRDLNMIMAPTCSKNHREAVKHYLETKIPRRIGHETEILATRKNGNTFPANISFSVSEAGGKIYFTGIVRDLTETKELQNRIIQSERLAALGQVVAEISHEIKNPLMMIGGFARQLAREITDEKSVSKLNIVVTEVARLENLLSELRDLYSPRPLDRAEMDINEVLREIYELVREDCERRNIQVKLRTDVSEVVVSGDREKLKQVFLNFLKNAVEAIERDGLIVLSSTVKGKEVEINISDNGCGIPQEQRERIFTPFFTTKKQGTGLGLSISKSILESHPGCSLGFESEKGRGTTFKVNMPVLRVVKDKHQTGSCR